jgi:hypothetical protein
MEWFKKHQDAVIVLSAIIGCMLWMNGEFNDIEKDLVQIKTVLILKNIIPSELAHKE